MLQVIGILVVPTLHTNLLKLMLFSIKKILQKKQLYIMN